MQDSQTQKRQVGLQAQLDSLTIPLSQTQQQQLAIYRLAVLSWNHKTNLISKRDPGQTVSRLIVESVALSRFDLFQKSLSVLDLGSGAGFPGVPLRIARPQLSVTLLDSKRMKCLFLRQVAAKFEFENLRVVCDRAEQAGKLSAFQKSFDVVVSRAVAPLPKLFAWSQPFLKPYGRLVAVKGSDLHEELAAFQLRHPALEVQIEPLFCTTPQPGKHEIKVVLVGHHLT
ncbi:MAG: 16S rRNA (guanine(527)-N(7))-methyltransferase RsmG [bacterium]